MDRLEDCSHIDAISVLRNETVTVFARNDTNSQSKQVRIIIKEPWHFANKITFSKILSSYAESV